MLHVLAASLSPLTLSRAQSIVQNHLPFVGSFATARNSSQVSHLDQYSPWRRLDIENRASNRPRICGVFMQSLHNQRLRGLRGGARSRSRTCEFLRKNREFVREKQRNLTP